MVQIRHPMKTVMEIAIPIISVALLLILRWAEGIKMLDKKTTFDPFTVDDYPRELKDQTYHSTPYELIKHSHEQAELERHRNYVKHL